MKREEVHHRRFVRLLIDHASVPAGTWATVDSTGTMQGGAWWFTVRWRPYTPIPNKFPREATEYSTNLWESDLALFEAVSAEEQETERMKHLESPSPLASYPKRAGDWQGRRRCRIHPNQLGLFFGDDFKQPE
jgi:hypothetical protein